MTFNEFTSESLAGQRHRVQKAGMEVSESLLTFSLVYEDREVVLQLSEYYTVEFLKIKIHKIFGIPPHQQKICGWKKIPENENTILQVCAEQGDGISNLTIRKSICNNMDQAGMSNGLNNTDNSMEAESSIICITKLLQQGLDFSKITFHSCTLGNAINEACFSPFRERKCRKALLLYLHNEEDRFSSAFCENLNNPEVSKILKESFFLLGWSISESKYETVLVRALNDFSDLSDLTSLVTKKNCSCDTYSAYKQLS
ncbi:hypothetical protein NQ317_001428 [Molorchus minor]|uniref:Fas-associated factor 1/2-like UAS domain-containing protein n=1 Tax=Molorchus minor TaxID=1323400 RepID=A0ABQ9K068_9CUCU|nr:hypothetical protein NQ317_001428 [Molorchus minor]